MDVTPAGLVLVEAAPGVSTADLQARTGVPLLPAA
jgi:acyl CoA:acetate/3-ketoacid CoA transferase beta subunit